MKRQIEVCDFCKIDTANQHLKVGANKCVICSRWTCKDKCLGVANDYHTTSHFPQLSYGCYLSYSFICKDCWSTAQLVDYSLIAKGVDIRGSGSSWAIRLGEFVTASYLEKFKELDAEYVDEVRRLIKLSGKLKAEQLKKKLKLQQLRKYQNEEEY